MKSPKIIILLLCMAFIFNNCYQYETIIIRFNLSEMTGMYEISNIVSVSEGEDWKESDTRKDWNKFLKDFNETALIEQEKVNIKEKQLFEENNQLNAVVHFTFNNFDDVQLFMVNDGNIIYQLDEGLTLLETNGTIVTTDSAEYVSWPAGKKDAFVKLNLMDVKSKLNSTSLLSYWRKWKEDNK
jgi:hypothetical protein